MNKHKQNIFAQKFRLLSSQESEEINWSSSESSEFENVSSNADKLCNFAKKTSRKRKRKKTVPKNISNLDITIIDLTKDAVKSDKSDICTKKPKLSDSGMKSPILGSTQYFSPYRCSNVPTSPILSSKTLEYESKADNLLKSPILILKRDSPKVSPNVRKKLFKYDIKSDDKCSRDRISNINSEIIDENDCLDRRKCEKDGKEAIHNKNNDRIYKTIQNQDGSRVLKANDGCNVNIYNINTSKDKFVISKKILHRDFKKDTLEKDHIKMEIEDLSQEKEIKDVCVISETPETNMDDSMAMLKVSKKNLAKKIKNYFDNEFSSDNPSQQTISEVSSPKNTSKTSDEVEIISTLTQFVSNKNSKESIKQEDMFSDTDKKEKKIRYKKDGLAYRLNNLLKKQAASTSIWQHERFLAANSNFVLPKMEFLAFRVNKVSFKYGCNLIEAMDLNDDNYLILINSCHSIETILPNCIIKLYEPYTKLDFNSNCKLLINVTKFECLTMNI